jgi:phage gp45-like
MEWLRLIRILTQRLRSIAGRGHLDACVQADVMRCAITMDDGSASTGVPYPQHYGHAAWPPAGCKPFTVANGGDSGAAVIVAMGDVAWCIPLLSGEVAIYDDLGQRVHLTRAGIVAETPLDATITAVGNARLTGRTVEIHADDRLAIDCGGNGLVWTPSTRDDYVIGSTGASHPLHPPQVP